MREKVLAVTFDKEPIYHDRVVKPGDEKIIVEDKKGNKITLAEHKKLYPYKLDNAINCFIATNKRSFSVDIPADYCWNGADIPSILWAFVGSKDAPCFKVPSLVHDYLLEFKSPIYILILKNKITVAEYRRLTSLIFRDLLKTYGTKTIKSNIMSGAVQIFQATFNRKEWKI
jgi:hypothetical protein